jgi:hypothetical protein
MHRAALHTYYYSGSSGEPEPVTLDSVESTTAISVPNGATFDEVILLLPTTRVVTLSDASTPDYTVTWVEGSYDETVADVYTISGTLTLPEGVTNPESVVATVEVTVAAAMTPDLLPNQILWAREDNVNTSTNVDEWTNKYNGANDFVKISDARRPNVNATGIDGDKPSYDFTLANNDLLRTQSGLGLAGNYTYHLFFQCDDTNIGAVSQYLIQNTDNGTTFLNTGLQALIREDEIWVDFRKNDSGNQQRVEFPFLSTGWHVLTVKHNSNGVGASINIVKLDGALITKITNADPVTHNTQTLKIGGNSINANTPISGSFGELIFNSGYQSVLNEWGVHKYLASRYTDLASIRFFDETQFSAIDSLSEAWNGLDKLLRDDGKYDLVGGTLTGKIYYFEQGATINDWTATLLSDTGLEIQKLKIYGRDDQDRLILVSCHKDSVSADDNIGKLMLHRADTIDDNGAYTSADLITGRAFPQGLVIRDLNDDGQDEIIYAYQGTTAGNGGVRWFECSDITDVLDSGNWTEHTAIVHESAWWLAGFYTINAAERLVFSARTNRNAASVPGIYYLTPAATVTDLWTETTIDNSVIDFGHVDVGNFFGNVNDIIAQNYSNDDVYAYDAGNSFAESTIITGGTAQVGYNVRKLSRTKNGRNMFIQIVQSDWCYLVSWNGAAWERRKLFQTLTHPGDSELLEVDIDNSGYLTIFWDDNTGLASAHIYKFRI